MPIINGTEEDDSLAGTSADEEINGLDGADSLQGLAGNDSLYGGAGDDTLAGGEGSDFADGGDGFDLLDFSAWQDDFGVAVDLTLPGRFISASASTPAGQEFESWLNVEGIRGSEFSDALFGDAQDNLLIGGGGDDLLDGREGSDTAVYSGALADYSFVLRNGVVGVTDDEPGDGDEGSDQVHRVETYRFADGDVAPADLPYTVLALDDSAELPDYTDGVTVDVRANDSDDTTLTGIGGISIGSPLGSITAADVSASIVDGRIRLVLGSDFELLGSAQGVTVAVPYTIADGEGQSDSATLTLTVRGTNPGGDAVLRLGDELELNTTRAGEQAAPAVAGLAGGGFVATWTSEGQDGDGYAVIGRRYAADGSALGGEFQVNTTIAGDQGFDIATSNTTAVAALADGGFVVVWTAPGQDGDEGGIYAQRYNSAGAVQGVEFQVNTLAAGGQGDGFRGATVAGLAGGGFVVSWESKDPDSPHGIYRIAARQFDAAGNALSDEFRATTFNDPEDFRGQNAPVVSALADGGYVIAWRGNGSGDTVGIFVRRFDASGAGTGDDARVNTETASTQSRPEIATLVDGGFVVAWTSFSVTAGDAEPSSVKAQVYNADGSPRGGEFLVNTKSADSQSWVAVAALGNGGFLISWSDSVMGQAGPPERGDIKAQLFDAAGQKIGAEFLVNTVTSGSADSSRVAAVSGTEVLVVWTDTPGLDSNIAAQRFTIPLNTPGSDVVDLSGPGGGTAAGGDGDDIYVVDDPLDVPQESAGEGVDTVRASLSWTLGNFLENLELTGAGDLRGTGNALANAIVGNSGANTLDGGAGADTLSGGTGGDTYYVDDPTDVVIETAPASTLRVQAALALRPRGDDGRERPLDGIGSDVDTIVASMGRAALGAFVENGVLAEGTAARELLGNALANAAQGNSAANLMEGGAGNDSISSAGGIDVASFAGKKADYTVVVSGTTVTVTDTNAADGDDGVDTLNGVEVLLFNNAVQGLGDTSVISGTRGADTLDLTGAGGQVAAGGTGNDTYRVNVAGDATIERAGGGTDTVKASLNWTLWRNVENLLLGGSANLEGTGNSGANRLTGNSGANLLRGYEGNDTLIGAAGVDTLQGGSGDDTYLHEAGDVLLEQADQGLDTVRTALSHTLATHFEALVLLGATALEGSGNAADNTLTGNSAANRLNGAAGNDTLAGEGGADTLVGGKGNDTYIVGEGDVLIERGGEGTDTVQSAIAWTLGAELEHLVLEGSAAVNGTGNTLGNAITGNAVVNRLNGFAGSDTLTGAGGADTLAGGKGNDTLSGGAGNDVLRGEAGSDRFRFDAPLSASTNKDTVQDFEIGTDRLVLDATVFTAFASQAEQGVTAEQFHAAAGATQAQTAEQRLIYNTTTGALYYDADGSGSGSGAVQFALIGTNTHPVLSFADFHIVG